MTETDAAELAETEFNILARATKRAIDRMTAKGIPEVQAVAMLAKIMELNQGALLKVLELLKAEAEGVDEKGEARHN